MSQCSKKNNNLKTEFPLLCKEWNYSKNNGLEPEDFMPFSNKKVWWKGKCGHEWQTTIITRTKQGSSCPYCSGNKVLPGFNDFLTTDPQYKDEWDYSKNKNVSPKELSRGSSQKVWWRCSEGHTFQARICDRIVRKRECPYCADHKLLVGYNDLKTKYPEIASEWHPTKNGDLKPTDIMSTKHIKVWWLGNCGHEWQAYPATRVCGEGKCPICLNRTIVMGVNDMATTDPDLAEEWHPTKNGKLTPKDISVGYNKKVWWLGKCGHEWKTSPNSRSSKSGKNSKYYGCPVCANVVGRVAYDASFVVYNPDLYKEWSFEKNTNLNPEDYSPGSGKIVWWHGDCGHDWRASIYSRCQGTNCPYCSGSKVLKGFNDLESNFPELAKEWDYEKNEVLPDTITTGTHKKYWWKCSRNHSFLMTVNSRTRHHSGCPICTASSTSFPEQYIYWSLKELFPETQNRKIIDGYEYDIYIDSKKVYIEYSGLYWHKGKEERSVRKRELAEKDDGIFFEIVDDHLAKNKYNSYFLDRGNTIIIDSNYKLETSLQKVIDIVCNKVGKKNTIEDYTRIKEKAIEYSKGKIEYNKSLEYTHPILAAEWDIERNDGLNPKDVSYGCKKKVWWICEKGHSFQATPNRRTSMGTGCPICAKKIVVSGKTDFATERPDLLEEWNYKKNKDLDPHKFSVGSNKKVWWICSQGHEWEATIHSRKITNCPYCSHRRVLKGFNDLESINPTLAKQWHHEKNGLLKASDVMIYSHKKVWWEDESGHEWQAEIKSRTLGAGCPFCKKNKKESDKK